MATNSTFNSEILFVEHTVQSKNLNSQSVRNITEGMKKTEALKGGQERDLAKLCPRVPKSTMKKIKITVNPRAVSHMGCHIINYIVVFHKLT